jgi:hypothetical protein
MLAIIILGVFAGCGTPRPPHAVNARLPNNSPFLTKQQSATEADIGILAQCKQIKKYAKTVKGDWETHWYFTEWKVIKVTQGEWQSPNVFFIFEDKWPTPESGIVLGKALPRYWEGKIFHFWLDTSRKIPLIVSPQECSRIPPHNPLKRPSLKYQKPEDKKVYDRVISAAAEFFRNQKDYTIQMGGFSLIEEYEDFFVVEHHSFPHSLAVTIDKDTYEVRWVPLPPK